MRDEFSQRIKKIEEELLALKTASKYTSAKPMNYTSVEVNESGIYRLEYQDEDENILSIVLNAWPIQVFEEVRARTVGGKFQDVEVYIDPDLVAEVVELTVLSTSPVVGFSKVA